MMVGLANGIQDAEQKAIDAAKRAMEKTIEEVSSALDKIKGKASSFADTIRGGFSGFSDIAGAFGSAEVGTSLSSVIANQVGGAEQLAEVLRALKRRGAGKALLAEVAETGVGFGQALLAGWTASRSPKPTRRSRTIAEFSRQTGKALSEAFFGEKIDKQSEELKRLHQDLQGTDRARARGPHPRHRHGRQEGRRGNTQRTDQDRQAQSRSRHPVRRRVTMADNKTIDNGALTDFTAATDEVGGVDYQYVKLVDGTDGLARRRSAAMRPTAWTWTSPGSRCSPPAARCSSPTAPPMPRFGTWQQRRAECGDR